MKIKNNNCGNCHWFSPFTGDETYSDKILSSLNGYCRHNPVGFFVINETDTDGNIHSQCSTYPLCGAETICCSRFKSVKGLFAKWAKK